MTTPPKKSVFFIQDPFTEDVEGPLDARQLKEWFGHGGVDDWGVSRTPHGPWTPASKVKGLKPVNATEPARSDQIIPVPPAATNAAFSTVSSGATTASASSLQSRTAAVVSWAKLRYPMASSAMDWAEQRFPKSRFGRAILALAGVWLSLILVSGVVLAIGTLWSELFGSRAELRQLAKEAEEAAKKADEALIEMARTADEALIDLGGSAKEIKERRIRNAEYERAIGERP